MVINSLKPNQWMPIVHMICAAAIIQNETDALQIWTDTTDRIITETYELSETNIDMNKELTKINLIKKQFNQSIETTRQETNEKTNITTKEYQTKTTNSLEQQTLNPFLLFQTLLLSNLILVITVIVPMIMTILIGWWFILKFRGIDRCHYRHRQRKRYNRRKDNKKKNRFKSRNSFRSHLGSGGQTTSGSTTSNSQRQGKQSISDERSNGIVTSLDYDQVKSSDSCLGVNVQKSTLVKSPKITIGFEPTDYVAERRRRNFRSMGTLQ